MANKIVYKDGSTEILSDAEFENFPKEMESDIKSVLEVPDSISQPVNQQIQQNIPQQNIQNQVPQKDSGIVSSLFPRLSEAKVPNYSEGIIPGLKTEGTNIVKGILDVASLPGRTLATGVNVGYDASRGLPTNISEQMRQSESPDLVEDVVRSPFSIVPGVGEIAGGSKLAQGLGKIVSKVPGSKILQSPVARAIGKGLETTGENVVIGRLENVANDRDIGGGLGKDILLGSLAGIIPGSGKYVKEKNISDVVNVARKDLNKIPSQNMQDFFSNLSDREHIETLLGKPLDDMFARAKAEGLSVGELPNDFIGRYKKYNEILEKRGIGSYLQEYTNLKDKPTKMATGADLLITGLGTVGGNLAGGLGGYAAKKSLDVLKNKTPSIEKYVLPLTENLFVPQAYRAVTREKISDIPGRR